jgi:hypothetical protein
MNKLAPLLLNLGAFIMILVGIHKGGDISLYIILSVILSCTSMIMTRINRLDKED